MVGNGIKQQNINQSIAECVYCVCLCTLDAFHQQRSINKYTNTGESAARARARFKHYISNAVACCIGSATFYSRNIKQTIPQIFLTSALILLSAFVCDALS